MNLIESFKMAIDSILANKMRSFLTMLGIIIGISSVITILAIGGGAQSSITGSLESLGATTVNIKVDTNKAQPSDHITLKDITAIRDKVDTVKYVSPSVSKTGSAVSQIISRNANITGTNAEFSSIQAMTFVYGKYFNDNDFLNGKAVVVIDETAAQSLFGQMDCVGLSFNMGPIGSQTKVTVVGVTKASSFFRGGPGQQMPITIYTPATFLQTMYSQDFNIDTVIIASTNKDTSSEAGNDAVSILESRHNNRGQNIYSAGSALGSLSAINSVLGTITAFIGAVAAISLLVGGIGVMNIMLVSVTERTREIGIRKAIGAETNVILMQFLTESVILSLIGGVIGMALGMLMAIIISAFANITPSFSPLVVIGVILFSSAIGIVFGVYPARQAARLNPIDALRYE